ncbi:hypothetical protein V8B97DRAFT_2003997 [Scleroderma yunnanense]
MSPFNDICDNPQDSEVNTILRNLRGEHFRRARNRQGAPATIPPSTTHNQPTLPYDEIFRFTSRARDDGDQSRRRRGTRVAGPEPPRSWQKTSISPTVTNITQSRERLAPDRFAAGSMTSWRETALAPILCECPETKLGCIYHRVPAPAVPPLTQVCIRLILADCRGADLIDLAQYFPVHLRHALMRYAAVHAPLTKSELSALCNGQGSVDGELIVVGPHVSLHQGWFWNSIAREDSGLHARPCESPGRPVISGDDDNNGDAWDDVQSLDSDSSVLTSLSLVSMSLSVPTFLAFPPTITRLALISLPSQIPLQRLTTVCPLLVFLDLSYNGWLEFTPGKGPQNLIDLAWQKLHHLQVLGLRGTTISSTLLAMINQGRWENVTVIT